MVGTWAFLDEGPPEAFLDRLDEMGAGALVLGATPPIRPEPERSRGSDLPLPPPSEQVMAYADRVDQLISAADRRGIGIYIYGTNPHMAGVSTNRQRPPVKHHLDAAGDPKRVGGYWPACLTGELFLSYYQQRLRDTYERWPQISGYLNDGPEFGYEIAADYMHDNLNLFMCFGECCRTAARELGFDPTELLEGARALQRSLHALTPSSMDRAREAAASAAAAGHPPAVETLTALGGEETGRWLEFRQQAAARYIGRLRAAVKGVEPSLRLGAGSRLPAFAGITGYEIEGIANAADFVLPKLYLWMGGVDGLYGTVYRWVRTLAEWNPDAADADLVRFAFALFGFTLPEVEELGDFYHYISADARDTTAGTVEGDPFPASFFETVVADQVRLMIAAAADAQKVRPWLDSDHGGRWLSPHEVDSALIAAEGAGLRGYLFYCAMESGYTEVAARRSGVSP